MPSIKVIEESQEAVDVKPGSYVNKPVSWYNFLISKTSGPSVPFIIGSS